LSGPGKIDPDIGRLLGLAQNGTASRGDLFVSVADLMSERGRGFSANEKELLLAILKQLARQVETEVRQALSERLAEHADAPLDLILLLSNDRIEVARPVLLRSPILTEDDLIGLVRAATGLHRCAIAQRPDVGPRLAGALAEGAESEAILILLANRRAQLGEVALRRIVARAEAEIELQEPCLKHAELSEDLARRMCAFVSEALLSFITQRFSFDAAQIRGDVALAASDAHARLTRASGAERLVEKLHTAGQLKPALAVKALAQGQIDLFEHVVARLLNLPQEALHKVLRNGDPALLAHVCHAAGIDKAVFATLFQQAESLRGRSGILGMPERLKADAIFTQGSRDDSREMLRRKTGTAA
jgi:uncharacterized protein (DUF2336 family)